VCHSLDRLARNLVDLKGIVSDLTTKGVRVRFVKEALTFTGDDSAMSQLLLSVMGAFAEFERALILERQREGIAVAKKKGIYKGRKPSIGPDEKGQIQQWIDEGIGKSEIARRLGVSRATVYAHI
jgi:DNA invertase Pin-like site-specific DNA recombinase